MEIQHHTRSIRIAPRKLRLVIDKVRHQPVQGALDILPLIPKRGAPHVHKSLKAAIQAAEDANFDTSTLVIQRIYCDEGTALKRMIMHGRGRSAMIHKKYSHLSIVLSGETRTRSRKARSVKAETPETAVSTESSETASPSEKES